MKGVYECRPCKLTFISREDKDRHRADYTCKAFTRKRRLNGRRVYWCTMKGCYKPFGSEEMRRTHQEIVHEGRETKTKGKDKPKKEATKQLRFQDPLA